LLAAISGEEFFALRRDVDPFQGVDLEQRAAKLSPC
jgi:hypothetical protein